MKKQIGVLLFVLVVAVGLSGAVSAADWNHGKLIKKHKFKHKVKKQNIKNKQTNTQSNKIRALIINSPGARVTGTNNGFNTASTTFAGAAGIDDIDRIVFDVVDQAVFNEQGNRQSNDISALIINSPNAVVSGTNNADNDLEVNGKKGASKVNSKQNNRQRNKISALIINSPNAAVSGTNNADNDLEV